MRRDVYKRQGNDLSRLRKHPDVHGKNEPIKGLPILIGGKTMKIHDEATFDQQNVFGKGQANTAFAQYFIGNSYLNPLTKQGESTVGLANVTFEPGCRNNWHIHHCLLYTSQYRGCSRSSKQSSGTH